MAASLSKNAVDMQDNECMQSLLDMKVNECMQSVLVDFCVLHHLD